LHQRGIAIAGRIVEWRAAEFIDIRLGLPPKPFAKHFFTA
jgi:hypothetical protein